MQIEPLRPLDSNGMFITTVLSSFSSISNVALNVDSNGLESAKGDDDAISNWHDFPVFRIADGSFELLRIEGVFSLFNGPDDWTLVEVDDYDEDCDDTACDDNGTVVDERIVFKQQVVQITPDSLHTRSVIWPRNASESFFNRF